MNDAESRRPQERDASLGRKLRSRIRAFAQISPSRRRLIAAGVAVVAAIVGADIVTVQLQRAASIEAYTTALVNLVNGMTQQTAKWIATVDEALLRTRDALAKSSMPIEAALGGRDIFEAISEEQKRLPVNALLVADAGGSIVNSSQAWPVAQRDVSAHEFFRYLRSHDDGTAYFGGPVKDRQSGAWKCVIARRLNRPNGAFAGVVAAEISLPALEDFYRTAMPAKRVVTVARRDGVVLVQYPHAADETGRKLPETDTWYRLVAQGGGQASSPGHFDSVRVLAAVRLLPNAPLVVETTVDESEALAGWYTERIWFFVGGAGAILGAVLLLRLLDQQLRRLEHSKNSLTKTNAELKLARRQLDAALSNISQGLCFFDGEQKLIMCNRRYCEVYGLEPEAVQAGIILAEIIALRSSAGSIPDMNPDDYVASVIASARSGLSSNAVIELKDGRAIEIHRQPMPDGGWVATHEEITARRRAEAEIAFRARHDPLTGLANRATLEEQLARSLAGLQADQHFAVLFLDLDRFKSVNDTLGHKVGDELLKGVAQRLSGCVRQQDTVARLGGDEFVIVQVGIRVPEDATILAQRLLGALGAPHRIDGREIVVLSSIGIAIASSQSASAESLLKSADAALYKAKARGGCTFQYFDPRIDAHAK
jgi:diguanylate cyclase (GGDEF)-like protein